jgi:hypothetical protein
MATIRWIVFLPLGVCAMAIAQLAVSFVAQRCAWWVAAPLVLFRGVFIF